MKKPTVLTFTLFYLPGFRAGGPIRTISSLVERIGSEIDFRIVTQDRDSGDASPYKGVTAWEWCSVGKARVLYVNRSGVGIYSILRLVRSVSPDAIYLNSFFDPLFTQKVLLLKHLGLLRRIPVILAPRGEFSEGALSIGRLKKLMYIRMATLFGLYRDITWHASSELERADILRELPFVDKNQVKVAMNLTAATAVGESVRSEDVKRDYLRVCFLSRISPKKNLLFALQCLSEVKAEVEFSIYGPKEVPSYWKACEDAIKQLPPNVRTRYCGEVEHHRVQEALAQHDVFFFPTLGENYGHVIHEALTAGLPLIVSDQTPWLDLEERGVGWALSLANKESFARVIDEFASLEEIERQAMSRRAREYAMKRARDIEALSANQAIFLDACRGRP